MKSTRKSAGKMTKVVFRRYPDGQVIALFPDIPWSGRRGEITSYMHVGQHGAADYAGVIAMTRPAHEKEYRNPLSELRAIGYDDRMPFLSCRRERSIQLYLTTDERSTT